MADAPHGLGDDIKSMAWGVAKFLVVDDWNKLTDSKAPTWERALAGVSLLANFVGPEGKAIEVVAKPLLERAVEKIAEGGAREAMEKLLEHGGAQGLATVARELRSQAGTLTKELAADVGKLLESPALKPIVDKAKTMGHDAVEVGEFLEHIVTKSSLVPSLRALEGQLEKSPAILAAAAFGQRNTINQLLGYESLPSLPTIVGGARQLGADLTHAGSSALEVGGGVLHSAGHALSEFGKGAIDLEQRAQHAVTDRAAKALDDVRHGHLETSGAPGARSSDGKQWSPDMPFSQFEALLNRIRGGAPTPTHDPAERPREQHHRLER